MATYSLSRVLWMMDELNMGRCTRCQLWRPAEMFGNRASKPNGLDHWCRDCRAIAMSEPSPCGTPGWTRKQAAHLQYRYKMTPVDWAWRFEDQGHACYLCGVDQGPWVVDHNHECCPGSKKATCGRCVLGIACSECNTLEAALQRLIGRGGALALHKVLTRARGQATLW